MIASGSHLPLYHRIRKAGMSITRPDTNLARYKMIRGPHHTAAKENPQRLACWMVLNQISSYFVSFNRFSLLGLAVTRMNTDGLTNTSYVVIAQQRHSLYTKITVGLEGHVRC